MFINERLGVPEGIYEEAEKLKEKIIFLLNKKDIYFDEDIFLGNHSVSLGNIKVELPIIINVIEHETPDNEVYRMTISRSIDELLFKGKKLKQKSFSGFRLFIYVATNKINKEKIINNIQLDSLAHEIKHILDAYYRNPDVESTANYESYTIGFPLKSIQEFLYLLYYTSLEENLVRPTELLTKLKKENITKNNFKEFIENSNIFKTLNKAENFTIEKLIENVKNDPRLEEFIETAEKEGYKISKSKIDDVINLLFINISNIKLESAEKSVRTYVFKKISKDKGNLFLFKSFEIPEEISNQINNYLRDFAKKVLKYENNPKTFFEKIIKKLNFDAKKIKRKLLKLYDMIPENKNENKQENKQILNWELFLKLEGKPITFKIRNK